MKEVFRQLGIEMKGPIWVFLADDAVVLYQNKQWPTHFLTWNLDYAGIKVFELFIRSLRYSDSIA